MVAATASLREATVLPKTGPVGFAYTPKSLPRLC